MQGNAVKLIAVPLDLSPQHCVDRMPFQDVTNSQVERNTKQLQVKKNKYINNHSLTITINQSPIITSIKHI